MRKYIDVRKLKETKPAFDQLRDWMLGIHGPVVLHYSINASRKENPWTAVEEGFTTPLCHQASLAVGDRQYYPSSKQVMANKLVKEFLPLVPYTLKRLVAVRGAFWIEVKELKTVAFHVFTFRGGGIGVGVGTIAGDMGMLAEIAESGREEDAKAKRARLRASAAAKLTAEERAAVGL